MTYVGPQTLEVFRRVGFTRTRELVPPNGQELAVEYAAGSMDLAERCVAVIRMVRGERGAPLPLSEAFMCPLTLENFRDPVVARNGETYERVAIMKVLEDPDNPLTTELGPRPFTLYPNLALLAARMRVWETERRLARRRAGNLAYA